MRTNDKTAFKDAVADMLSIYRVTLSAGVLDLWWNAIKDYNLTEIRAAIEARMKDPDAGRFCPVPADIIKAINEAAVDKTNLCWNCQGNLSKLGRTKLRTAYVCNPCYQAYLRSEWDPAKERTA